MNSGNLIKRRVFNHERRITNKNKNNKVIYDIGARVRLQEVKSKEFKIMGTVTEQRIAESGMVVSYEIDTDLGYKTMRHRRFMKPLEKEHNPKELHKFVTQPTEINNKTILEALNDTAAESGRDILEEVEQGAPRRSGRIKQDRVITGVTQIKETILALLLIIH